MFTRHEIFKHMIEVSDSEDESWLDSLSEEDEDTSEGKNTASTLNFKSKYRGMTLMLHLVDWSFLATQSTLTRLEPIENKPQERIVELKVGRGSQSFRWLALTARARLHQLYHKEGLVRQREAVLGRPGSFLPTKIISEDPESDAEFLRPNAIINSVLQDGDHVWLTFHQDGKSKISKWSKDAFFQDQDINDEPESQKVIDSLESESESKSESKVVTPTQGEVKLPKHSIFFPRQFESDSREYYDSEELLRQAFESDFKLCVQRSNFLDRAKANLIRSTIQKYYSQIRTTFRYFAASSVGDAFTMSTNEFHKLTRKCQVPDYTLDILWKQVNYNAENPKETDTVLERHEFMEMVIRLAHAMYLMKHPKQIQADKPSEEDMIEASNGHISEGKDQGSAEKQHDSSEIAESEIELEGVSTDLNMELDTTPTDLAQAIKKLMDEHFSPHCWKEELHTAATMYADPDGFRRDCLYFEEVNDIFMERVDKLYVVYEVYAHKSALRLREFNSTLQLLCCTEFEALFRDCGIVKQSENISRNGTSYVDVRLSFAFAQMTCISNVDRSVKDRGRDQENRATFVEFVEALARVCALRFVFLTTKENNRIKMLSPKLGTFLDTLLDGLGTNFWLKHKDPGIYMRKIQKKFGKCRNHRVAKGSGPEIGRRESDQSPEALALSASMRSSSAYRLPEGLRYIDLAPETDADRKKRTKKKKK